MEKPLSLKSARTLKLTFNLPISRTSQFWEGLKKGKVYATKCQTCKKLHFPPVADCGACGSPEMNWIELDGSGEIITYTQVFVKPASFSEQEPYIVAIAKLKEGGNALAWLTGVQIEDVKIGSKVKLVAKVLSDNNVTYEFIQA